MTVAQLPAPDPLANSVMDTLTVLAACLCEQITASNLPETCFCGVVPGDQVPGFYAGNCNKKCGMAWTRLVNVYPSATIGQPSQQPNNCGIGTGVSVELGMLRCAHVGTEDRPPTPAEQMADAQLQIADMLAMRRAVACCPGSADFVLGVYTPTGPQGGLVGGVWSIDLWLP